MIKSLSIVLPCYNEQEVIKDTYFELKTLINRWLKDGLINKFQIVIVNNGSSDKTLEKSLLLKKTDPNIKIVDLRNNYGYQSSISAGLFNADYEMIVSIDADLQDDPTKIEEMIKIHYKGFDMVLGVRNDRSTDGFFKRNTAAAFYKFLIYLGVKVEFNHGDFRLLSMELVKELKSYGETNRFLRAIVMNLDNNYSVVEYKRRKRKAGKTKFDIKSLLYLSLDAITSFSPKPIRLITISGILTFVISIITIISIIVNYFLFGFNIKGWASLVSLILFFGGFQLIAIGIIGEYLSKTYLETKSRPLYHIRKVYN